MKLCGGFLSGGVQASFGFGVDVGRERASGCYSDVLVQMVRYQRADDRGMDIRVREQEPQQESRASLALFAKLVQFCRLVFGPAIRAAQSDPRLAASHATAIDDTRARLRSLANDVLVLPLQPGIGNLVDVEYVPVDVGRD